MQVEFKIEQSTTGKTLGIAIHKKGEDKPFMVVKGCKIASGINGEFVSGPAAKIDDKWFNYLYTTKEFGAYITELALKDKPASKPAAKQVEVEDSMPF